LEGDGLFGSKHHEWITSLLADNPLDERIALIADVKGDQFTFSSESPGQTGESPPCSTEDPEKPLR
jgi:hypothetical protein